VILASLVSPALLRSRPSRTSLAAVLPTSGLRLCSPVGELANLLPTRRIHGLRSPIAVAPLHNYVAVLMVKLKPASLDHRLLARTGTQTLPASMLTAPAWTPDVVDVTYPKRVVRARVCLDALFGCRSRAPAWVSDSSTVNAVHAWLWSGSQYSRSKRNPSGFSWYSRRVPEDWSITSLALFRMRRCCEIAGLLTQKPVANLPTGIGPPKRRCKMARRVALPSASNWGDS
jgi:hypothetical protein